MNMPLDGVVVADFSRVLAGPLATTMLADLGATVIKVERPGVGDETRQWGPPWTEDSSSYFACANRSKRSIALDLDDSSDREVAVRLAHRADVLVENFRAGTLDRRGLGYDDLSDTNPGLVYCSITGFGSRAGAALSGYDFLVQAVGGLMSITGDPDGEPQKVGVALVDVLTSKDAVIGILAALQARASTGRGQRVEVNLLSSLLGSLANQASAYLTTGTSPVRLGNRHPSIAPYEALRCQDGLLVVCCGNDDQFRRLTGVLGLPALTEDLRFATNGDRVGHRGELAVALETALASDTAEHWVARLTQAGVVAGVIGSIGSALDLAGDLGLDPVVEPGQGSAPQVRHPITYSATPVTSYLPPPRLGADGDEIRAWLSDER